MGEDEEGTHRGLGEFRRAVDPLIAAHGGRMVGTAGDSLLADFSSVVDAVNCAVEMQRASRAINGPIPSESVSNCRLVSTSATSSSMVTTSSAMASMLPPGSRRWLSRHRVHFADRLRPGQEQARSRLPPARQPSRQEHRRTGACLRSRGTGRGTASREKTATSHHCRRDRCFGSTRPCRLGAPRGRRPGALGARRRVQTSRSRYLRRADASRGPPFDSGAALQESIRGCRAGFLQ
jgi:hypothetical protein